MEDMWYGEYLKKWRECLLLKDLLTDKQEIIDKKEKLIKKLKKKLDSNEKRWKRMAEELWHLDPHYLDVIKKIEKENK